MRVDTGKMVYLEISNIDKETKIQGFRHMGKSMRKQNIYREKRKSLNTLKENLCKIDKANED